VTRELRIEGELQGQRVLFLIVILELDNLILWFLAGHSNVYMLC
jgi:hypothetical protein